jgi:excisionase family DNA binding protein
MSDNLLTPSVVCQRLSISRRTLQRFTDSGRILFVRVGAQIRVPESALAEHLKRNTRLPAPVMPKAERSRLSTKTNHERWHVARGIVKVDCPFCAERAA